MANIAENIDNEYVLTAIIAIRENNKRPDSKAIRDYINKNFAADVEEELIESIIIELLDHNIIENRPTPKGNSYFIRKKNNTPIDVISADRTQQINECELLVSDTDQQFNEITLKSQSTPVIESTPNKLSHTEDTSNRYTKSKSQFKQPKINNSTISKLENYVDQKFDEAAMKHLKENIMSDIKYQFSDVAKAKDCSQLLIDSLKDQINSLQNEIRFLREELKVKNLLLEITITSKKIDSSTIYPSRQQIDSQTQKISDEKKCCLININGNNNITIKPLTQKDSVEISVESKNNSDIKSNAREERGIATNTTEDICGTQNNSDVNHIKNDAKKPDNQLYHNLLKDTRQKNDSQFNTCTKNGSNSGDTQQQQENVLRPPKKSAFIVGDSMIKKIDGYLLTSSINHKYIVKVRPFVTAKTDDMYDHIKPTQRNFQPNVYISHVGTNDLPTDMTPEEISEKIITFSKHLKSEDNEVVVSGIVPRGDYYKEKAEAVNKVLKDACTKENMHFICHSNINVERHLNRSNLHLNDHGISALVRNFKNF